MKLSIPKNELQRGLGRIQSIVEKRNTMPILANVLLPNVTVECFFLLKVSSVVISVRFDRQQRAPTASVKFERVGFFPSAARVF